MFFLSDMTITGSNESVNCKIPDYPIVLHCFGTFRTVNGTLNGLNSFLKPNFNCVLKTMLKYLKVK